MRLRQEALAAAAIFDDHPTLNWMKLHLIVLTLLFASLCAADPEPAQIQAPVAGDAYHQFIAQLVTPENLTDCILRMDGTIDDVERFVTSTGAVSHGVETETKVGLHLAFSILSTKQTILYYLVISRNGQELSFSDATKMAALFCDFPIESPRRALSSGSPLRTVALAAANSVIPIETSSRWARSKAEELLTDSYPMNCAIAGYPPAATTTDAKNSLVNVSDL